jgi:hypothetical protein
MHYTDLGAATGTTFGQPLGVGGLTTAAISLLARTPGGLGVEVGYAFSAGSESYQVQSIRGAVRVPF